jgi:hypothetical protein
MSFRFALLVSVLPLSQAGCLCPPCPGTAGPATPTAAQPAGNAAPSGPTPDRLVIWDGDKVGAGQSWADCDKDLKPKCKSTATKTAGAGTNGSAGLKFHVEGPSGWAGMGWNWFGWYPETAGTDLSPYANLTFQIRVEAKSPDTAPDPAAVTALLGCSKGTKNSASIAIQKYTADFADGKWHKISVPVPDFLQGADGAAFDAKTAWEFRVAYWGATPRDFNIYLDDIAVEK